MCRGLSRRSHILFQPSGHLLDTFWTFWTCLDAPQTLLIHLPGLMLATHKDVTSRKLRPQLPRQASCCRYGAEAVGARRVRAPPSTPARPPARPPPSGPGPPLSLLRSPAPHRHRARTVRGMVRTSLTRRLTVALMVCARATADDEITRAARPRIRPALPLPHFSTSLLSPLCVQANLTENLTARKNAPPSTRARTQPPRTRCGAF